MGKKSAGILGYRYRNTALEVLLVHPGGPYFRNKDLGAWSIPKGEFTDEDDLTAAKREFMEELGFNLSGEFIQLSPITQKGGKTVFAWAILLDIDVSNFTCNTFQLEWPPRSGKIHEFPEVDKARWFALPLAKQKIIPSQAVLIDELASRLNVQCGS